MKRIHRLLGILLIILLFPSSIISCGDNEEYGEFIRYKYKLPDKLTQIYDFNILDNGNIAIIAMNEKNERIYYISENKGRSFHELYKIEITQEENKVTRVEKISVNKKGELVVLYSEYSEETKEKINEIENSNLSEEDMSKKYEEIDKEKNQGIYLLKDKNDYSKYSIEVDFLGGYYDMTLDENGDIYILSNSNKKIYKLDKSNGKILNEISTNEEVKNFAVVKDSVIYSTVNKVYKCNTNKDKVEEVKELDEYVSNINMMKSYYDCDELYFISGNKLFKYDVDNKVSEVFECGYNVNEFVKINNKEFLVIDSNLGELELNYYNYKKTDKKEISSDTIRVYSLYYDDTINQLINRYSNINNKVNIKYEYGISEYEPIEEEDAIKVLNTELLAGKGPDILILDNLPVNSYINKDILIDISDAVNKNKDSLFTNVYNAYCNENKEIYTFPIHMKIPIIVSGTKDVSKINDISSFTEAVKESRTNGENNIMNIVNSKELINLLYYSCAEYWINSDKSINEDKLKEFLVSCKSIYESTSASLSEEIKNVHNEDINLAISNKKENRWYSDFLSKSSYGTNILAADIVFDIGYIYDSSNYLTLISGKTLKPNLNYSYWKGQGEQSFLPVNLLGINKNSSHIDESKKFIEYALSDEAQRKTDLLFLSTNRNIVKEEFNNMNSIINTKGNSYGANLYYGGEQKAHLDYKPLDNLEIETIITGIEGIKKPISIDKSIILKISSEIESFISGQKSLDDTMNNIKDKLQIYLSE